MTLTLSIEGARQLDNGSAGELVLDRRGAIVGRAATCDWALPDPTRYVSSRHFEIRFDNGSYLLTDCSTNGTMLATTGERLVSPHRIVDGDRFQVGSYVIGARLTGGAEARTDSSATPAAPVWQGWDTDAASAQATNSPPFPSASTGWDALQPSATGTGSSGGWQPQVGPTLARREDHQVAAGWDSRPSFASPASGQAPSPAPRAGGWQPDAAAALPQATSVWEEATPLPPPASAWSSAAPTQSAPVSPDDLWGRIAEGNVVDWARGGFGQPVEAPRDPLGLSPAPGSAALPRQTPSAPPTAPAAGPSPSGSGDAFARGAGLDPGFASSDPELARAGGLFRRLVAGLVVMVEARARAKAQLGAEATAFSPDGHNPLKFARTPDEAIGMLLGPRQPGFLPSEHAIEEAFRDLQSHQVATLRAMQGALRATLERFSPTAIRARANAGGMIERILPAARDAALWQAYEREFGGVAQGSDEAFLEMFAKEFRQAYNEQSREAGR
ncbi:type VI secretion system-associated FHA domain protein TagH [Sphingomonas sp. PAMC26645]|uniref:type VI secretion system-associated FHA domain protein TagH n=1 Tax=Sphingomonas sp. PAMC26645 TaxID=2565555 RepID=UPI00109DEAFC|nr:type VI secretion system-associated FHA domain protein TagH [Sphingomonas sp. PAMC26645]QCB43227.1 type VI secretion system-associated FHA domain protein TagH [Sphingomonas sp. PAMC26645]